ncbi:MAG: YbaB/EbfC family nucleoid-associated protein [bacterium]
MNISDKFGQAKKMMDLKRQADSMKREMQQIKVEVEEGRVKVIMNGAQEVERVEYNGEDNLMLERAFNKALKESQKKVAKKMQGRLSDMGLGF